MNSGQRKGVVEVNLADNMTMMQNSFILPSFAMKIHFTWQFGIVCDMSVVVSFHGFITLIVSKKSNISC